MVYASVVFGAKIAMKLLSYYVTLSLSFLFFINVNAFGSLNNCPDEIRGYWKLDESITGSYTDTIAGLDGECGSICPSPLTAAVVGRGQLFDGNDTISVPAALIFNWLASESFSIELWVRRNTGTISGTFETFVGRSDAAGLNWYIGINSVGRAQAMLKASDGSGPSALTGSKDLRSSSTDPTWHHVALVRDGDLNTNTLYVDGEAIGVQSYTYSSDFTSDTAPLAFGSLNNGNYFSGGLDEVAIYGRVLSEKEIKSHYYLALGYCNQYDARIRIMPLGDSITKGNWDATHPLESAMIAYRLDLWELLENNLMLSDFIGSENHGQSVDPDFDDDHAGIPGINDSELLTLLTTGQNTVPGDVRQITPGPYLETYPTQIILLHVGTNDLSTVPDKIVGILDEIDAFSKNVTVLLARIIDQVPHHPDVTTFNDLVEDMVVDRIIAQGDKIIMVDMESGAEINYVADTTEPFTGGDMYNTLHPNPSGYSKMAAKWFETLETILPQSETPAITSTAPTDVLKGALYTYTVTATGPPSPTLTLTTKPTNMTFNAASGLVQWTPTTAGDYQVVVRAQNWAGVDTQSFTISVYAQPQAVGDAFAGIEEGGVLTLGASEGVLINDTDENNDPLTAVLESDVSHGTLALNADGSLTYTHDGSENFTDSFTYRASNGKVASASATVSLTISPVNDPPMITGQGKLSTKQETPIQITLANFIVEDPDNQSSDITMLPIEDGDNYTVSDGNTILPNEGFTGQLSVPVKVSDGIDDGSPYNALISVDTNTTTDSGGGGGGGCFITSTF